MLKDFKKVKASQSKPSDTHHVGSDRKEEEKDCGKYNMGDDVTCTRQNKKRKAYVYLKDFERMLAAH
ncbi:hypothetical protein QQF64_027883 [Cirrhinus molitorella]|uniref:Uncharacterized protein n=1 Tax=Cirrhinus molitorella TaxID=172907 RepID=A0ABR3NDN8_9TELE